MVGPEVTSGTTLAILYARESDIYGDRKERMQEDAKTRIETSPKQQIAEEMELARALGAAVRSEDVHVERYTGLDSIYDRPEIQAIREKVKTGRYRYFICYDTDRLARDPIHTGLIMQECMKHKCELKFVKTPVENSDMGMVILFVRGLGDKMEAEKFKDRSRRARAAIVSAGRIYTQGKPLYGYRFDHRLHVRVVNDQEAKVVVQIFKYSAEGLSAKLIAERLNSTGVPSPAAGSNRYYRDDTRGAPKWGSAQVQRILNEEQYTGVTYVYKHSVTDKRRANGKYETHLKPRGEWKRLGADGVEVTPRIISDELFASVQAGLRSRSKSKGSAKRNGLRPYLLRGRIFCSECGSKMYPMSERRQFKGGRTESINVYRCSARLSHVKNITCSCGRVFAREVEDLVWNKVGSFFRQPEVIEREVRRILDDLPADTVESDLTNVIEDLAKQERLYNKMYDRMTRALRGDDDMLAARLDPDCKRIGESIKAYQGVAAQLRAKLAAKGRTADVARQFADHCRSLSEAFDLVDIPFERKVQMLNALRVKVLAHSQGDLKMQTNLGAFIDISPEIRSLVSTQTGTGAGRRRRWSGRGSGRWRCAR